MAKLQDVFIINAQKDIIHLMGEVYPYCYDSDSYYFIVDREMYDLATGCRLLKFRDKNEVLAYQRNQNFIDLRQSPIYKQMKQRFQHAFRLYISKHIMEYLPIKVKLHKEYYRIFMRSMKGMDAE